MTTATAAIVRTLNLARADHRALANKLDALDTALALPLPVEARTAVESERDAAVAEVPALIAADAAAKARPIRVGYVA